MDNLAEETTLIVLFSVVLFIIGAGIVLLVMLYQRKQSQFLLEKQKLQITFQKELLKTQLETQEQTFHLIGEELHDNIGQLLSSTRMLLGITERAMKEVPDTFHTADQTLAKAIQDLRMLSKSLNKEWLHQFNLLDNLHAEVHRINLARTIEIKLQSDEKNLMLSPESQVMLFRIIQEALQNSIRHSEARVVLISISQKDHIEVKIKDDGLGMNVNPNEPNGVGLLNMNHRTTLLGGSISWTSLPGEGTEVIIQIPVQNHDI